MNDLTVIIPTYNECLNIGNLIGTILRLYPQVKIIVSDDGSTDGTKEIVLSFSHSVFLLDRTSSKVHGLTASVVHAVSYVKTKYFVVLDGDFQHPLTFISNIYQNLILGSSIVIGSRKRRTIHWEKYSRKFISDFGTFLGILRLKVNGVTVRDPLSGFFGMRTSIFRLLNLRRFVPKGYKVLYDVLKQMNSSKIIQELYFEFQFRKNGSSKIAFKHFYYYLLSMLK
ncbi:glycosyltransferase [Candidatus Woesearchaeota archaeon]|nr:glycosyltransferase [Candidatus Woesearchaeota archaeon]